MRPADSPAESRRAGPPRWEPNAVKITPENFVKITLVALVGTAVVRMIASKLNIPGLSGLAG